MYDHSTFDCLCCCTVSLLTRPTPSSSWGRVETAASSDGDGDGDRDGDRIPYGAIRRGPDTNRHKCHRSMYTDMPCTHTHTHVHTLYASAYLYIDSLMKSGILDVSIITTKRRSCCKFPHIFAWVAMSVCVWVCVWVSVWWVYGMSVLMPITVTITVTTLAESQIQELQSHLIQNCSHR